MIDRGQVFVRAQVDGNRWDSVDVLDLDDESFRRFVINIFTQDGRLTGLLDGRDTRPLKAKPGIKKAG